MVKYLGAVLAQLSNFHMQDTPNTRDGTHPDQDIRLRAIIQHADLATEANQIQLNAHVCGGLQLFFRLTDKEKNDICKCTGARALYSLNL
jgi:hypothetical protein